MVKKLVGNEDARSQDFVLRTQKTSGEHGFRNVSQKWYDQTISIDEGLELLEQQRNQTHDIFATVQEMIPAVNDNGMFTMKYQPTGEEFTPTEHCLSHLGKWASVGRWYAKELSQPKKDRDDNIIYTPDRQDAETLAACIQNGWRRVVKDGNKDKNFMFRCRKVDGENTMRAMLTEDYAPVDNRWALEIVKEIIPGGRLSHWRGDQDTIYGNVLIPDTIRREDDGDYGAMSSMSNSEIGERTYKHHPSLFRAICQNGCIWGQIVGEELDVVHRGEIDLDELRKRTIKFVTDQIPLVTAGIDDFLGKKGKDFTHTGESMLPLFAEVAVKYKLTRPQATKVLTAYRGEKALTPGDNHKSLFYVVSSITAAGQKMSNAEWVRMDTVGGQLAAYTQKDWQSLVARANELKEKDIHKAFAPMTNAV